MPTGTITPQGSYLTSVAQASLATKSIRLGIILDGLQRSDSQILADGVAGTISTYEYNAGGWTRPTVTTSSSTLGSYNSGTLRYEVNGEIVKVTVTAPTGGFSIRQIFTILDGSVTPRDVTGQIVGFTTFAAAIVMAAGDTLDFKFPWTFRGA